jgi:enamine deaminase RidA (YjgF/YER057c/UK114 family)
MSQAVAVQGVPLAYTRQILPLDREGKIVGEGSADQQIEQVLANLDAVLGAAGSGLNRLVRLNVYALSHQAAGRVPELLAKRLGPNVRPAITTVLTPLPHRKALVAMDALAAAASQGQPKAGRSETGPAIASLRCQTVAGDKDGADVAALPRGGAVYLSGVPERGTLTQPAVTRSMSTLLATLGQLRLRPADVVQLKVFCMPASAAEDVLREIKKFFPGQLVPPVVFVEWLASAPVEIELVAQLPPTDKPAEAVQYYTPPDLRPLPAFSRVALVRADRQVFISGLSSRAAGNAEAQARDVFAQLKSVLAATGCDALNLAKATYYVSDDDASKGLDKVRSEFLSPDRPPAASKVTVHGVGQAERTLTVDAIAVGRGR